MSTSRRGVITPRTGRSPSRMTPEIIARSPGSITPRLLRFGDQDLDLLVGDVLFVLRVLAQQPQQARPRHRAATPAASETRASIVIAGATCTATRSGLRSAICFGTSSPTISEK